MIPYKRAWQVALGVTAALLVASCGGEPDAEPVVSATPSPTAGVPAGDPRLPEGTYQTPELTLEQLVATAVAAGFDQAEVEASLEFYRGATSIVYTLKLEAGRWTEFESVDDGPAEIGWSGTYEVIDEDTVVATDPCGAITYAYSLQDDTLTLDMVEDECQGYAGDDPQDELIAQTTIFETAPFTRIG